MSRVLDQILPGRGINLGGALDGGAWEPEARHFDAIAAMFDTLRLPVKWDAASLERVDRAVDEALARGLAAVLTVHHYADPEREAFLALWRRIAGHFADRPVYLELWNEPHDRVPAGWWNALLAEAVAAVRDHAPEHTLIAGPTRWNNIDGLRNLELPADDRLIATVHYYWPFEFTHQGATWLPGAEKWLGARWGSEADRARVRADLEEAAAWARERGVPLFLGEFGTCEAAPMADRSDWTACVRAEAERLGVAWCYWAFATDFAAYDLERDRWREPLRRALAR
jgi:endoglucanase